MLFKIIYRQWNCFLSSHTTDGKDGLGLKLEIAGPTFSSFNAMPAKTNKKVLTHLLLEILPKTRFEASWVVFWLPLCYKELKLTTKPFTGRALHSLLIQMQTVSLRSSCAESKILRSFLGLKVTQQFWLLLFAFFTPLFFRFSCLI